MFSRNTHQTVHLVCLLLAAFLMPLSVWLLSVVSMIMSANWLLGGEYRRKINILRSRPAIPVLSGLFVLYLLWLLNTSDMNGALAELRLKLPLLFFPIVAGSDEKADFSLLRAVLLSFVAGCIMATGAGFLALAGILPAEIRTSRDLALFVPSIRLSVFLCFAIFSAMWLLTDSRRNLHKTLFAAAAAVMVFFLFRLLSVTGLVLFVLLLCMTGLFMLAAGKKIRLGITFLAAAAAVTASLTILSVSAWQRLHDPADPSVNELLSLTASGNSYTHYHEETLLENGYLVWTNVCEEELRQEWNRKSIMNYDGTDAAGNELRVTLIRYITALGMAKDSAAVAALSEKDISNIENGYANPLYAGKGSPMARAYEIAWELDRAVGGANPSGHSLAQRPEFYRAAAGIIRKNPWTGTGTGDVAGAFRDEYETNDTPLKPEYRLRAHNQYLTFGVTFGIPGMMLALALLIVPWLMSRNRFSYLFLLFMTVIIVTMFNDDTFSSFTGAAFFSYFYTLLIITGRGTENVSQSREEMRLY